MAPDEIYERLGLTEPIVYRVAIKWCYKDDPEARGHIASGRRTGRTTGAIVAALAYLSETDKPVAIAGHTKHSADEMLRKAQQWASRLGLDASKLRGYSAAQHGWMRGRDTESLFVDHAAWEVMDPSNAAYLHDSGWGNRDWHR
jgi:hypothetical protein